MAISNTERLGLPGSSYKMKQKQKSMKSLASQPEKNGEADVKNSVGDMKHSGYLKGQKEDQCQDLRALPLAVFESQYSVLAQITSKIQRYEQNDPKATNYNSAALGSNRGSSNAIDCDTNSSSSNSHRDSSDNNEYNTASSVSSFIDWTCEEITRMHSFLGDDGEERDPKSHSHTKPSPAVRPPVSAFNVHASEFIPQSYSPDDVNNDPEKSDLNVLSRRELRESYDNTCSCCDEANIWFFPDVDANPKNLSPVTGGDLETRSE